MNGGHDPASEAAAVPVVYLNPLIQQPLRLSRLHLIRQMYPENAFFVLDALSERVRTPRIAVGAPADQKNRHVRVKKGAVNQLLGGAVPLFPRAIPDGLIEKDGAGNAVYLAGIVDNARALIVGIAEGKIYSGHDLFVLGGNSV